MPTGQQIQLLLNGFRVLIFENIDNFTQIALENEKKNVIKLNFFANFGSLAIFSYKTAFYSLNHPTGQRVHSLLNVFNVLIHKIS